MPKFATMYTERKPISVCPGNRMKDEMQLRIVDGNEELEKIGETDLYEYIQSHKDSVDIKLIIDRCASLNDYSLLFKQPAQFMDTTYMPKSLVEAHAMVKDAENYFALLPVEIKEQYDNNFTEFISDLGSPSFEKKVGDFLESIKPKESEVNDNA